MKNKLFPNGNPYKSDYWQPDSTGSDTTNPHAYKIALSYAEAEHILRKAADSDAMWYKRNAWKMNLMCLGIGVAIGVIVTVLMWK